MTFADLMIFDPPYNLTKNYNGHVFHSKEAAAYTTWFDDVISSLMPLLRPTATVYACGDRQTSALVFPVLDRFPRPEIELLGERKRTRSQRELEEQHRGYLVLLSRRRLPF